MMSSVPDTTELLREQRRQTILWEQAPPGSRAEFEAAEAGSRAGAELDAALSGGADLPVSWQLAKVLDEVRLRERIEAALDGSIDSCARCKVCDKQIDAVMAAIARGPS